jgi:magnesium-transporting ATPase (P-type)
VPVVRLPRGLGPWHAPCFESTIEEWNSDSRTPYACASIIAIRAILPRTLLSKTHEKRSTRLSQALANTVTLDVASVYGYLKSRPEGLSREEADARLAEYGQNVLAKDRRPGFFRVLWHAVRNPLVVLLAVLAGVSFATGDPNSATVMLLMIALSVGLRLVQEAKASSAATQLKAMISVQATVLRSGTAQEVAISQLVPGDVVQLAAGDMIPGDVRVLYAKDLFVVQGSLTGESFPVEKFALETKIDTSSPLDLLPVQGRPRNEQEARHRQANQRVQNLGAMDILCTDKTGTLTRDEIILERYCDVALHEDEAVLALAYINSVFVPFLPMSPLQILANNLLYDVSQTAIPTDAVDLEQIQKPRAWDLGELTRFILLIGPCSSIFDYTTFFLMLSVFGCWNVSTPEAAAHSQSLFQTGWFVESLLTQTLIIHVIRTRKMPFIQSRASAFLIATSAAIMAVGVALPFTALGRYLGLSALPASYWPYLAMTLLSYVVLTQRSRAGCFAAGSERCSRLDTSMGRPVRTKGDDDATDDPSLGARPVPLGTRRAVSFPPARRAGVYVVAEALTGVGNEAAALLFRPPGERRPARSSPRGGSSVGRGRHAGLRRFRRRRVGGARPACGPRTLPPRRARGGVELAEILLAPASSRRLGACPGAHPAALSRLLAA